MPALLGCARQLSQYVFPPIVTRRSDEPVHMWNEFAYGFQYMSRLVGVYFVCSRAFTVLPTTALSKLYTPKADSVVLRVSSSPLRYLDIWSKILIHQWAPPFLSVSAWEFIKLKLVCPILEEVIYRGLGHVWGWLMFVCPTLLFAHLCLMSRLLARFYLALYSMCFISNAAFYAKLPYVYFEGWCTLLTELGRLCAMAPAMKKIFQLSQGEKRMRQDATKNDKPTDSVIMTRSDKWMCQKVYATVLWLNHDDSVSPPRHFQVTLQRASAWSARLYGSTCYGLAHLDQSLQKCVGNFASSLLVESRLAVQRRNFWAPVGAHVAYNLLAPFLALVLSV